MKDLFYMGGPLFMSILTILLVIIVFWILYYFITYYSTDIDKEQSLRKLKYGRSIGLFALVMGVLGQLIGFYMAFSTIEQVGDVSPAILFGGIKVSMISTMYGIVIYLISIILWFITSNVIDRK